MTLRATPFHARAAGANRGNDWLSRGGFTLARVYSGAGDEALAARARGALADISWRWRVMIEGARAGEFLSRLVTKDAARLEPGQALKALWLNDGGAVRGAGAIARYGKESFLLISAADDKDWIAAAASRFGANSREIAEGGLALIGPYADAILKEAGIDAAPDPLALRKVFWRGLDVTLSRFGEHGGCEIWCAPDDGLLVWDRLMRAGAAYGLQPAGTDAMDILDLEAGIARPMRDFAPARDGFVPMPTPKSLGLTSLIESGHDFNGRAAYLAQRETKTLIVIEIDSATPAPHTPLQRGGKAVGRTLSSLYSPALRRAIALAIAEESESAPGTEFSLMLSPSADMPEFRSVAARAVPLPFLEHDRASVNRSHAPDS